MNIEIRNTSLDTEIIKRIVESDLPVVVWGAKEVGQFVAQKLRRNGVKEIVHAESNPKNNTNSFLDTEIDMIYSRYILAAGFLQAYEWEDNDSRFMKFSGHVGGIVRLGEIHAGLTTDKISKQFFLNHKCEFEEVYNKLADEKSKRSLEAYLSAKINEDANVLKKYVEIPQYFSGDFINLKKGEVFVDCGAYDGDSISDFIEYCPNYSKIYALEPDALNLARLRSYIKVKSLKNIVELNLGAYSEACTLSFASDGIMSSICAEGTNTIKTDMLDNIVGDDEISYIKMDIEGSEAKALIGAEKIIKKYHPKLGISAYHKKEDVFELFNIINDLYDGYKFYFRVHKPLPIDAVLYAVPNN